MIVNRSISKLCGVFSALFIVLGIAQAQVIFVSQGGTGDGSSWENAAGDLRVALSQAQTGQEVWVSGGTYTPTTCSPCSFADRDTRFVLPKGVKLLGGFSGTEQSKTDRTSNSSDPSTTVRLSGQIQTNVDSTRSFTVLESIAPTEGTLIERIHVESGRADDDSRGSLNRGSTGSLLYITTFDTSTTLHLEIKDCVFQNGYSRTFGGAVFVDVEDDKKSKLRIENCSFDLNEAGFGGGAIAISSRSGGADSSEIINSDFDLNSAGNEGGGGLLLRASDGGSSEAVLRDVVFSENSSPLAEGGAIRVYGKSGSCSPRITNCRFENNSAHFGGAVDIDGGYEGKANPVFRNCSFKSNQSSNAGGAIFTSAVFNGTSNFEIYRSTFESNLSGESGGAVLINAIEGFSKPYFENVVFFDNTATLYGGAVYNLGKGGVCSPSFINCTINSNHASSAGGVYCLGSEGGESSPLILNCVFVGNQANVGGALYSNANDSTGTAEPFVANTVFANNSAANGRTLRIIYGRPHLLNCFFDEDDCESLNSGFGGMPVCLEGNIFGSATDLFDVSPPSSVFDPFSDGPLIDAGNDSILIANEIYFDALDDARFRGARADIGVVENSSDTILWNINVSPTEVEVCQGTELDFDVTVYPDYPSGSIFWIANDDTLSNGRSLSFTSSTSQTINVEARVFGESRTVANVVVNVLPTIETSLTSDVSNLPDTLCLDSTYLLQAIVSATGADYSIQWLDENGNFLTDTESIFITPVSGDALTRSVEVAFDGACLDTASRSASFDFDLASCGTSTTTQAFDFKTLTVFPNPTSGVFTISGLSEKGQFPIEILNMAGQTVYSGMMSASNISHNIYSLPQGLYSLVVQDEQMIYRVLIEKL